MHKNKAKRYLRKKQVPSDFPLNNIEVQGCQREDVHCDYCGEMHTEIDAGYKEDDAHFFSVYVHSVDEAWNLKYGATLCLEDFDAAKDAREFAQELAEALEVEVHDYSK